MKKGMLICLIVCLIATPIHIITGNTAGAIAGFMGAVASFGSLVTNS